MVEELRRQNEELRNEVKALKITRGQCHQDRTPGPKTPTTAMFTPMEQPVHLRRTPGGTQVPPGTPPQTLDEPRGELPEIPPWPWSKFEQGRSAGEWSSWERRQRELHHEGCGGGLHRHAGFDRGVYSRWHELCDGEGKGKTGPTSGSTELEGGNWTVVDGVYAPCNGSGRFQVARLQWHERELQELKSRMKTHETKHGGHGVPVWQKSDGLWMHADEQQPGQGCVPPPPPMSVEVKKPDGGGANFDWGPRSPDLSAKDEPKDDLRAINVTLPRLPWMKAHWITEIEPLIGDVSGGAARWWAQLMSEVTAVYKVWLSSDALTRLEVDVQVNKA